MSTLFERADAGPCAKRHGKNRIVAWIGGVMTTSSR
jgi:hypothetical protein